MEEEHMKNVLIMAAFAWVPADLLGWVPERLAMAAQLVLLYLYVAVDIWRRGRDS
jgi:hypothetical protein